MSTTEEKSSETNEEFSYIKPISNHLYYECPFCGITLDKQEPHQCREVQWETQNQKININDRTLYVRHIEPIDREVILFSTGKINKLVKLYRSYNK